MERRAQWQRARSGDRQVGADAVRQHPDRRLRGTVVVVDLALRGQGAQAGDPVESRRLPSENQAGPRHDPLRMRAGLQGREM